MKCWFQTRCGRKDICSNLEDCGACVRYNQMYLQTVEANIPGMLPLNHQLEKPKDPSSPDWQVYQNLYALDIQAVVESGRSIVIESTRCGNGKTTWAQRLLLKYLTTQLGKEKTGYFISLPQALFDIKKVIDSKEVLPYEEIFQTVKLLVLDDVGHKKYSEYEENWLLRVLSLRQMKGLSTIYTMNSKSKISDLIGDRLYSRIYTASEHFYLAESDKRGWPPKDF